MSGAMGNHAQDQIRRGLLAPAPAAAAGAIRSSAIPNAVRADVQEEFVSTQAARERYGVVLRENLSIDHAAAREMS